MRLTRKQYDSFRSSRNPEITARELLNIQHPVGVGDTTVIAKNAQELDVFKDTGKAGDFYYIIIMPIDDVLALAYSVYPRK